MRTTHHGALVKHRDTASFDAEALLGGSTVDRALWTFGWFTLLFATITIQSYSAQLGYLDIQTPVIVLLCLVAMPAAWICQGRAYEWFTRLTMAAALGAVALFEQVVLTTGSYYASDEGAFNDYATNLLLHGHNPYLASMSPSLSTFPLGGVTDTTHFAQIFRFSYPAGSLWLQSVVQGLGVHHLPTAELCMVMWVITGVMLIRILPRSVRPLVPLLLLAPVFFNYNTEAVTDALFIPFLLVAIAKLRTFLDDRGSTWSRWVGPMALGAACSIKQGPWFCAPFLALAIVMEAQSRGITAPWRVGLRYVGIAAGTFAAINAPFIIDSPRQWLSGILLPLTTPLIPNGTGFVFLVIRHVVSGAHYGLWGAAGVVFFAGVVLAFAAYPQYLKRVWVFAVPVLFFFSIRSYENYYAEFFAPALVLATSNVPAWTETPFVRLRRLRRYLLPAIGALFVLIMAQSFQNPTFNVTVDNVFETSAAITGVNVTVHNNTNQELETFPTISIYGDVQNQLELGSGATHFWLAPGETRTLTLYTRGPVYMPVYFARWFIQMESPQTDSVANSPVQSWL